MLLFATSLDVSEKRLALNLIQRGASHFREREQRNDGEISVREDVAPFNPIYGEHVEAGGCEVVAVINQVPISA